MTLNQVPGDVNVARKGHPVQCESKVSGNRLDCKTLNDGNRLKDGYQPDCWKVGDWCGIELDREYGIHAVVFYWETAKFVAPFGKGGYEILFRINGAWQTVDAHAVTVSREPYSGEVIEDRATLSAPARVSGVRVRFLDGGCSHQYAPKLYELEILSDE